MYGTAALCVSTTNTLETKLLKYEQLLQKVPEKSIPIDVAIQIGTMVG